MYPEFFILFQTLTKNRTVRRITRWRNTDSASFLGFDMEMAKLTNIQASEAAQIVGIGVDARVDSDFPRSLSDIHQTFTISRIFPERASAPNPTFVDNGGPNVTQEYQPSTVAIGTETNVVDSVSSDTTIVGTSASTQNEDATGEKGRKKARVD
ncbi:unnamed protein product [Eruca vesicaria subsp. sativa]|uniref:Uncharacterized protein n=1 Tax=Eruca vesicaria subsp. sativa TaxID=29727 RepID=A0ABC8JID1_ERUVS|nr:unnamed protein product [Eruca vesicaria subsp. sativa]